MKRQKIISIFTLFLAAFIWGTAFSAQKIATQSGVGTFLFNASRFFIGALTLLPICAIFIRGKWGIKNTWKGALLAGMVLFAASNLQQAGIDLTQSASRSGFITGFYLILVPFALFLFFREKISRLTLLGAVSALLGLYFICITETASLGFGDVLLFVGCLFWTAHILVIDRKAGQSHPLVFSMLQFFFASVFSFVAALIFEEVSVSSLASCILPLLYVGVLSSGVAYTCQVIGQRHISATASTLILSCESLFAALSGALVNHEPFTLRTLLGAGLLFVGIVLSQLPSAEKTEG